MVTNISKHSQRAWYCGLHTVPHVRLQHWSAPHFTDEETEVWRALVSCPKLHRFKKKKKTGAGAGGWNPEGLTTGPVCGTTDHSRR